MAAAFSALLSGLWRGEAPNYGPLLVSAAVVSVLGILLIPMPPFAIDILFSVSIALSIIILLMTLFIEKPTDLSSFPTVLLLITLFRLSLNVASTRLILTEGHKGTAAAGKVIEAFGHVVMQGSVVIGLIIFSVLLIINFIVVTKGAGRIAEVAARFTLDAMPGKQMAIDADLSAGLISEAAARSRRRELEEESNFYAAMDGASKFVKGDAIAGIIITIVNILGGLAIGTIQEGLSLVQAIKTYTVLSTGDGLVSQIPGLVVLIAAGLLVTKSTTVDATDNVLSRQFMAYPLVFLSAGGILMMIAVIPSIPFAPFALLALSSAALALFPGAKIATATRGGGHLQPEARMPQPLALPASSQEAGDIGAASASASEQDPAEDLRVDDIRLEFGYALLPLFRETQGVSLGSSIRSLRRNLARDFGFLLPNIHVMDSARVPDHGYSIIVKEHRIAVGQLRPNKMLAINPSGDDVELPGEATRDPAFGIAARWIDPALQRMAEQRGLTVVDTTTVLTTHLGEVLKRHMPALVSYSATQSLLDGLPEEHQRLVQAVIPSVFSVSTLQSILRGLLQERISIRNLPDIIEAVTEWAPRSKTNSELLENVRFQIRRHISYQAVDETSQTVNAIAYIEAGREADLQNGINAREIARVLTELADYERKFAATGEKFVLVVPDRLRPIIADSLRRQRRFVAVLAQRELEETVEFNIVGRI